jgi:predicted amidohydrolase
MKIVVLQRDIVWAQPAENCRRCSEAIDRNLGADLYVLPEMFSTGFCPGIIFLGWLEKVNTALLMPCLFAALTAL